MDSEAPSDHSRQSRTQEGVPVNSDDLEPPAIADHRLLRCIGRGSYGVVWLAQNTMGTYRAIKIVYRNSFKDDRPFERELAGMRKFEPISRSHEGFVHILHVGINAVQGYFYYVMELGDDQISEQTFDSESYVPRTLAKDITIQGKLPSSECLHLGLALSLALAELHKRGLVHRDVKPSNIIFVNGVPKLADIGLVTTVDEGRSYVGTEGFIPPEGPGSAQADIYSLGKVLYEACTGKDRQDFPELPTRLDALADHDALLELNEVILTACKNDAAKRYQTAWDMHADLLILVNGKSVRRLKTLENRQSQVKRIASSLGLGLIIFAFFSLPIYQTWRTKIETRQRQVGENVAYGNRAVESGDPLASLPYFAEVLRLDQENSMEEASHRLLFGTTLAQCPKLNQMWFLEGEIYDGEFNSNGSQVIIPEFLGTTRVYDLQKGILVRKEFKEGAWVRGTSWSADGQLGITASEDKAAYLWNASTLKSVHSFSHPDAVLSARFSPDGSHIVTSCVDGLARLWNTQSGNLEHILAGHAKGIRFADFSHDGHLVATAGEDYTVRLWDTTSGQSAGNPLLHGNWVNYLAFSPDDKILVTASSDRKARLWSVATGQRLLVDLNHQDGVTSAQFGPDGRMILTSSLDGTARIWELDSLQSISCRFVLRHSAGVMHAAFSPDGHHILTTCTDGTVRLWDLAGVTPSPATTSFVVSRNGNILLSATNGQLKIMDTVSKRTKDLSVKSEFPIKRLVISKDGHFALGIFESANDHNATDRALQIYDLLTQQPVSTNFLPPTSFTDASISDDGKTLAFCQASHIEIWDVEHQKKLGDLLMNETVESLFFSSDGKFLAARGESSLKLWTRSGQLVFSLPSFPTPIVYADFSPNSHFLVTCYADNLIHRCCAKIWSVPSGRPGPELWHNDGVLFAAFSPDNKQIVTAGEDYTARIWDVVSGKQLVPSLKHEDAVRTAKFSSDGSWIVTACADRTARIWSAGSGDPLTPPLRQSFPFVKAQFVTGEKQIITSDSSDNSWLWDLTKDQKPRDDVRSLARILSGGEIEPQKVSLKALWHQMDSKYPLTFATPSQNAFAWDKFEADDCERTEQWFAARFHIQRLLATNPDDPSLIRRLANVAEHLKQDD